MYIVTELLESLFGPERRTAALQRLRRAVWWFVATGVATVVNPWGWDVYRALILQQRVIPEHQAWFREWQSVPLNWNVFNSLALRDPGETIYLLLAIAVVLGAIALLSDRPGAGIFLLGVNCAGGALRSHGRRLRLRRRGHRRLRDRRSSYREWPS